MHPVIKLATATALVAALTVFGINYYLTHGELGSKHEWAILQSLESRNRSNLISEVEITTQGEYQVASLMADDGKTRL